MSRSALFLAASVLALSACQPAADAPEELAAETPPAVADEVVEAIEAEVEVAAADVSETTDAEDHDHDDDDHDEDHGEEVHDHEDEHDHAEEDEEHAHDEHDDHAEHEDHDDHDHASGEAHVHGVSDLAASLDGATLSISLEGALANFGIDETLRTLDDAAPYTDTVVSIVGGDCARDSATASIRPIGDHGNLQIDLTYTCGSSDDIEAIDVVGFQSFSGFEEVNAVFLTDAGQTAETLTASDTRLDIS